MRQQHWFKNGFGGWAIVAALTAALARDATAQCDIWQNLGAGLNDRVFALTVYNGELIAGGAFSSPDGAIGTGIARWSGTAWQSLLSDTYNPVASILALTVYNGELIAGGGFYFPGESGVYGDHIARWDGTTWHRIGNGLENLNVYALTVYNGELIAAGKRGVSGPTDSPNILRWNGSEWRTLGNGLNDQILTLAVAHGELIAGGWFWMSGTTPTSAIARWNGSSWQEVGYGTNGVVNAIAPFNGALIAGGSFTQVGYFHPYPLIAAWHGGDGDSWSGLGDGVDGEVSALSAYREELIAGGEFTNAGGQSANNVATWNGAGWHRLGDGMNGKVSAMTVYNGDIIAGGTFTTADGLPRDHIARWRRCYRCSGDVTYDGYVNVDDMLGVINQWAMCPALPATCGADVAPEGGDGVVNVNDLLAVINAWGPCPTGACWLPNNTCTVNNKAECYAADGLGWVNGATCVDSDGDRIPNAFELNDHSGPALPFVGTDPAVVDTDGDSISDGDEFYGTTAGLNLPAIGANPLKKNAFVEIDWVKHPGNADDHNRPHPNQIDRIQADFADAFLPNPIGSNGITVIFDYGQGGLLNGGNQITSASAYVNTTAAGNNGGGLDGELQTMKTANFAANRSNYFHYLIMCDKLAHNGTIQSASGEAEFSGNDLLVALGSTAFVGDHPVNGQVIMHELGHNLGLRHGGDENKNFKPNYRSIMNYRYQGLGIDVDGDAVGDGALDFSYGLLPPLDEQNLIEVNGIFGPGSPVHINWNFNGDPDETTPYDLNINCRAGSATYCGDSWPDECDDSVCEILHDFNDWTHLVFTGINDTDFIGPTVITCDPPLPSPKSRANRK